VERPQEVWVLEAAEVTDKMVVSVKENLNVKTFKLIQQNHVCVILSCSDIICPLCGIHLFFVTQSIELGNCHEVMSRWI
jgi:hypothetical protein